MHLYAHKAKFFTIGPSIGIFSFQQLFAGMEAQQDLVCAAESAAFYRLTDKNEWMANASSLTASRMELRFPQSRATAVSQELKAHREVTTKIIKAGISGF